MRKSKLNCVLLIIAFTTASTGALSQRKAGAYAKSDYYSNLQPGDPERAALGSYGKTPINYYTGMPEVSLNLLTLTSRDLSLPISINYDASGVKINDISSPVGMKWNLNAGGYVARQMNGFPDEEPNLGYWRFQNQMNGDFSFTGINTTEWVSAYEKNTRDFEPDEFVLFVNGRSIKFLINKGVPMPIPRQNVNIKHYVVNNKIDKFELITEDGTKYTFGGSSSAIEERKVETLNISTKYDYDYTQDKIFVDLLYEPDRDDIVGSFNLGNFGLNPTTQISEAKREFYNDKWYLISIVSPTGDQINLSYTKDGYQKYVTVPNVTRIDNVVNKIDVYTHQVLQYCVKEEIFTGCVRRDFTFTHNNVFAYAKFDTDCLDATCPTGNDWTSGTVIPITQSQTDKYFDPKSILAYEVGGIFINQSLITESVIRLTAITTSVGNRLTFTTSSRADLPSAIKYDRIDLFNVNNFNVKSIKLNYSTINAATTQDYLWLSEAYMATRFSTLDPTGDGDNNYYAHHFKSYSESRINAQGNVEPGTDPNTINAQFRKYAFEGLKDYNFKRLFLENVIETTNYTDRTLYSFVYSNRGNLRRRNSPMQDNYGFAANYTGLMSSSNYPEGEHPISLQFGASRAMLIRAYKPAASSLSGFGGAAGGSPPVFHTDGLLTKIVYPTGGSTQFNFGGFEQPVLNAVLDKDETDQIVQQRQLNYLSPGFIANPITTSYRNVKDPNSTKFYQLRVVSSNSQNRRFRPSNGAYRTFNSVKVFNGTSINHQGYEIFNYRHEPDVASAINLKLENGSTPFETNSVNDIFPFPRATENDHLRGQLLDHYVYDKNNVLLNHSQNEYIHIKPNGLPERRMFGFFGGSFSFNNGPLKHRYGWHEIRADWLYLDKTTTKIYDQNSPQDLTKAVSMVTKYEYDPIQLQPIEVKTYNQAMPSDVTSTKTKYVTHADYSPSNFCMQQYNQCIAVCGGDVSCFDTCDSQQYECYNGTNLPPESKAIVSLQSKRQINSPVEIQSWIQSGSISKLTSAIVYKYNNEGSGANQFVKPKEIWGLKQPLDATAFTSSTIDASGNLSIDPKMRKLHRYDLYDQTAGTLRQQTSLDGTVSAYEWGFNNSLVTQSTINPGPLQQQSSYIHQPLIGLSRTTDPNLRNSNFEYDRLNRLKLVRDHDNNILNRYRYHYIGQDQTLKAPITVGGCQVQGNQVYFYSADNPEFGETSYTWNFGDGTPTSTGSFVTHTYASAGTYTVTAKKSNPEQYGIDANIQVTIQPTLTSVSICADGPIALDKCGIDSPLFGNCTELNTTRSSPTIFTAVANGPANYFSWEYSDLSGQWISFGNGTSSTHGPSVFVIYGASGTYQVRCKVGDACGNQIVSDSIYLYLYSSVSNCPGIQID
jgi:hypothetical protein